MAVIEVTGAHKTYARFRRPPEKAVDGLDLVVEQGGVHGFLGPNGSGKTTTIRMLLGLVGSDGGDLRLFGRPVPHALPTVIPHVGALVETPLFFPNFSGRLNLRLLADVAGVPPTRVEECLETVQLRDRADDKFKGYSLGMKQRLGIAAALLKNPRLLDPRRAEQRAGPPGHRGRPRAAASARLGRSHDGVPLQPPARRGPAGVRPRHDPRPWSPGGPTVGWPRCWPRCRRQTYASASRTRWVPMPCWRPPGSGCPRSATPGWCTTSRSSGHHPDPGRRRALPERAEPGRRRPRGCSWS